MRCKANWMLRTSVLFVGMLAMVAPANAGIDDFKLTAAIPADAALAVHTRSHDGQAFLNEQLDRVWAAVQDQHFENDLRTLLKALVQEDGGDIEEFDAQWQQFSDLLLGVEWSTLAENESAFAMKLSFPIPEMVVLLSASPEKAATNFTGLEGILKTLMGFAPEGELNLATEGAGDAIVHRLTAVNSPFPLGLTLARQKGTILIGLGQTMPEQSLALLTGGEGKTLASTERFQAAFKKLPPPTDEMTFMDMALWMSQVRVLIQQAMAMADPTGENMDPAVKELPGKFIDALDVFDYIAAVATTDGLKTTTDSVAVLQSGVQNRALYRVLFSNEPLANPLKFIPQNAQNMNAWNGVRPRVIYDEVLRFIKDEIPEGEDLIAEWEDGKLEIQENIGLDVEADILDWIGGGLSTFTIPGKSTYSPGSWVLMLTVSDEEKARGLLEHLSGMITPMLAEQNGMIDDAHLEGAEGFKVVVHPMLAMMLGQPTFGVTDGHLFLGSSPKAIEAALATASGANPNFASNERFLKEGLPLGKNVVSIGFSDLTKMGEELGGILEMVSGFGYFIPDLAKHPLGRTVLMVANKLGKVCRELNFFQSSASQTTFDGQVMYTRMILNYREPPKAPTAGEEETPAENELP